MWCVTPVNPGSYGRVTKLVPDSFLHVNAVVEDAAHGDWCRPVKCLITRPDAKLLSALGIDFEESLSRQPQRYKMCTQLTKKFFLLRDEEKARV